MASSKNKRPRERNGTSHSGNGHGDEEMEMEDDVDFHKLPPKQDIRERLQIRQEYRKVQEEIQCKKKYDIFI